MYQIKQDNAFYFTMKVLNVVGLFPTKNDKAYLRKYYLSCFLQTGFGVLMLLGTVLHLMHYLKDNVNVDISEDFTVIIGAGNAFVTRILFLLQSRRWSDLFNKLNDFSKFGKPPTFKSATKKLNTFSQLYVLYILLGCFTYASATIYESWGCEKCNKTTHFQDMCGTFIPIWFPFDFKANAMVKWITFAFQAICSTSITIPGALICYLVVEATEILISTIESLKEKVESDKNQFINGKDKIAFSIEYHCHILSMADELNFLIKSSCGHVSVVAAITFGSISNQVLRSKPLGALVFLVGWVSALFMLCHAGQRIRDELLSIGDAVYASNWYKSNSRSVKDLRLMIMRSQKPFNFSTLPVGTLDYSTFLMIVKASYSYMTLLAQSI